MVLCASVVAVGLGVAVGLDPGTSLRWVLAVVVSVVLLLHVEWAALVVVATAVFTDYLDAVSPWTTEWLAAVLVLAWLVRRAAGRLHRSSLPWITVPALALGVVLVLALTAHPNGAAGVETSARLAGLVLVAVVLADCLAGPLPPARAARVFVLSCSAAALCGLVNALASGDHRVSGPLARPDDLAFFLVAALPLVGVLTRVRAPASWATRAGRRSPRLAWGCFALLALGVLGTQSQAGYVATVVVLAGAAATRVLSPRHAGAVLLLAATAAAFTLAVLPHPVGDALSDPQRYAETGLTQRFGLWRAAGDLIGAEPALGVGPDGFAVREVAWLAQDPDRARDVVELGGARGSVHSTPLQVGAELGLLGAAAFIAVLLAPAVVLLRRRRPDRLTSAVLVALAGTGAASLLETEHLALPLWFLAALAAALAATPVATARGSAPGPQTGLETGSETIPEPGRAAPDPSGQVAPTS